MTSITVVRRDRGSAALGTIGRRPVRGDPASGADVGTQLLHDPQRTCSPGLPLISGLILLYVLRTGNGIVRARTLHLAG